MGQPRKGSIFAEAVALDVKSDARTSIQNGFQGSGRENESSRVLSYVLLL